MTRAGKDFRDGQEFRGQAPSSILPFCRVLARGALERRRPEMKDPALCS